MISIATDYEYRHRHWKNNCLNLFIYSGFVRYVSTFEFWFSSEMSVITNGAAEKYLQNMLSFACTIFSRLKMASRKSRKFRAREKYDRQ